MTSLNGVHTERHLRRAWIHVLKAQSHPADPNPQKPVPTDRMGCSCPTAFLVQTICHRVEPPGEAVEVGPLDGSLTVSRPRTVALWMRPERVPRESRMTARSVASSWYEATKSEWFQGARRVNASTRAVLRVPSSALADGDGPRRRRHARAGRTAISSAQAAPS